MDKAEVALNEVLAEIKKLEDKKHDLNQRAQKGGVKGMAAGNELSQLETSDPLPLRRAVLTAQAALRLAQKTNGVKPMGKLWFVQHELEEASRYKPKGQWKRGGTFKPTN